MSTLKLHVRQIAIILLIFMYLLRESWALCSYRGITNLPPEAFSYWSSWGCYSYSRPDLFVTYPLLASSCKVEIDNKIYDVPGLSFNGSCVPFDFSNSIIKDAVDGSFKISSSVDRWIDCSVDAQDCCTNVMLNNSIEENHCPAVWDAWSCFKSIPSGQIYEQKCSRHAYAAEPPRCHHYSYKECFGNGTWKERTDYESCSVIPGLKFRTNWHIALLSLSILFCTPAALALIVLNSQKLNIVRNLVFSIILRDLFVILVKSIIIMDELTSIGEDTVMSENKWGCKFLTFLEKFFVNIVFACMLLEGIYLHQLLTNAFGTRQSGGVRMTPFYIVCIILVIGSALTWAIVMAVYDDKNCWQVTEGTDFDWILVGPRLLMLLVNLVLLVHIVWALWNAFRSKDGEHYATMRTVKAALICLPLFGIPFFFVIVHPNTDSCALEQFYYIVDYSIEALQGVFIVIFHCYREREVRRVFKSIQSDVQQYWQGRKFGRNSVAESISNRRSTMKSNLTQSENRFQRQLSTLHENNEERINNGRGLLTEPDLIVPNSDSAVESKNTKDQHDRRRYGRKQELLSSNTAKSDDVIEHNFEISLDPKMLFKDRADNIVLLDPADRKIEL